MFVKAENRVSTLIFSARIYQIFSGQFDEDTIFFPMCIFVIFVNNQVTIIVWHYIYILYYIILIQMSVFIPEPCYFHYYGSVV